MTRFAHVPCNPYDSTEPRNLAAAKTLHLRLFTCQTTHCRKHQMSVYVSPTAIRTPRCSACRWLLTEVQ